MLQQNERVSHVVRVGLGTHRQHRADGIHQPRSPSAGIALPRIVFLNAHAVSMSPGVCHTHGNGARPFRLEALIGFGAPKPSGGGMKFARAKCRRFPARRGGRASGITGPMSFVSPPMTWCQHYRSSAGPPQTMGRNATERNEGNKGGHPLFVCFVSFCWSAVRNRRQKHRTQPKGYYNSRLSVGMGCTIHGVAQKPILPHPHSVEYRRAPKTQIH